MKPKTELLLYQLLWMGEQIAQPTFRNMSESFEGWAYRSGRLRHIHRLEAMDLLETEGRALSRIVRLTEKGRRLVAGERDPLKYWSTDWDGIWRMVLFDVPEERRKLRSQLRYRLKEMHFGWLQKSVWISPRPMERMTRFLKRTEWEPESLTLMESRLVEGEDARKVAAKAWDFSEVNEGYERYGEFLNGWSKQRSEDSLDRRLAEEKALWDAALRRDPLLPSALLPKGYKGKRTFNRRRRELPKLIQRHINR